MFVNLQHQHGARPISSPIYVCQTSRFKVAGIFCFLYFIFLSILYRYIVFFATLKVLSELGNKAFASFSELYKATPVTAAYIF